MGVINRFREARRARADGNQGNAEALRREALRLIEEGNAIEDAGRLEVAMQRYEAAIGLLPDLALGHHNRGNVLLAMGDTEGALAAYATALEKDPDSAAAHFNTGNAYARIGRYDDALAAYRRAIALKPDFADAEVAMGNVMDDLGRLEEAVSSYRRATQIKPEFAEAHFNLGNSLKGLRRLDESVASLRRAVEIRPDFAEAHHNLGIALEDVLELGEAEASFRRALAIKPDFAPAHHNLLFCLSHDEAVNPEALYAEHCRFGERFEGPLRAHWPRHGNDRDPARCLQVGLVSGDLREHAVAHFVEPILQRLAGKPELSLHAYYNHVTEGQVTSRLRGYVKHWHRVAELTDEALASKIVEDGIDILVDLSGHTAENRLLTFARKPAPVQASWIGYPGTTGLKAMDYYLADRHFLPPGEFEGQFTEKLVYLPANAPFLPDERAPLVNELPALSRGHVTFGSFNRLSKLSRSVIALWSRLLRELPDSRMVIGGMPQEGGYESLIGWFVAEGVTRERVAFHRRCDVPAYLALHHQVDMCLDTFPYTGGTTTEHALWMGVPTLTLAGRTAPGRQGAAMLGHVGLEEFVAGNTEEFVQKGIRWARDTAALAEVRAGLRQRCEQSPIRRPDIIAAALERALRTMWQRWCTGLPPEAFEVSPLGIAPALPKAQA